MIRAVKLTKGILKLNRSISRFHVHSGEMAADVIYSPKDRKAYVIAAHKHNRARFICDFNGNIKAQTQICREQMQDFVTALVLENKETLEGCRDRMHKRQNAAEFIKHQMIYMIVNDIESVCRAKQQYMKPLTKKQTGLLISILNAMAGHIMKSREISMKNSFHLLKATNTYFMLIDTVLWTCRERDERYWISKLEQELTGDMDSWWKQEPEELFEIVRKTNWKTEFMQEDFFD